MEEQRMGYGGWGGELQVFRPAMVSQVPAGVYSAETGGSWAQASVVMMFVCLVIRGVGE